MQCCQCVRGMEEGRSHIVIGHTRRGWWLYSLYCDVTNPMLMSERCGRKITYSCWSYTPWVVTNFYIVWSKNITWGYRHYGHYTGHYCAYGTILLYIEYYTLGYSTLVKCMQCLFISFLLLTVVWLLWAHCFSLCCLFDTVVRVILCLDI